ncbi:MAG TPA: alanine racemase [Chthonomonadaceae bacterium]|nr:alanine racemase [Chthonomonadaceae bacterium]
MNAFPCRTHTPFDSRAWIEVDLAAIRANVALLSDRLAPHTQLMAVVKADGYGHGLVPVAQAAIEAGAAWIGVATVEEGATLRHAGVHAPIALLCPQPPQEADAILAFGLTACVGDTALLNALAQAAQKPGAPSAAPEIHLDIETGIGRSGFLPEEAVALWRRATSAGLRVTGLCTHFADADGPEEALTTKQWETFQSVRAALEQAGARFDVLHSHNSAAVLRVPVHTTTLVRPGELVYGILPALPGDAALPPVQPALTLKTRVASVRSLPAGHPISYGATHHLTRDSRVATVLIGYGDGYARRLSGRGWMLIRGQRAPILGRVCMDQTVVDVTDIPDVEAGEEVVCIGRQGTEQLRVEQIAALLETTEHEITTSLTDRLPRCYLHAAPTPLPALSS